MIFSAYIYYSFKKKGSTFWIGKTEGQNQYAKDILASGGGSSSFFQDASDPFSLERKRVLGFFFCKEQKIDSYVYTQTIILALFES